MQRLTNDSDAFEEIEDVETPEVIETPEPVKQPEVKTKSDLFGIVVLILLAIALGVLMYYKNKDKE